ncbi:MAG TPA: LysM domain-containing protein, partial [Anaerolineales bacterium]
MFAIPLRYTICFLLGALLLSSCGTGNQADAYPTYDPFAPVNGGDSQVAPVGGSDVMQPLRTPFGPTPTRAPITVDIPPGNSKSSSTTPTPDLPHPIPTPRDVLDQYTVQSGDTLGSIASAYGVSLESLMQANGLDEASILMVGMVLDIPPVEVDPNPGSSFKIIPDSELVYG